MIGRRTIQSQSGAGIAMAVAVALTALALALPTAAAAAPAERQASAQTGAAKAAFRVSARPSRRATRPGQAIGVAGKVRPQAPRQRVLLQARLGGRWRVVGSSRLSRRSTFKIAYRAQLPGGHLLRVLKPKSRNREAGASPMIRIVAMAQRTVRSNGGELRLGLGPVQVVAPKGAIRKGKTLTIRTARPSGPRGFPDSGAISLAGGPYILTTSQRPPSRPVTVKLSYDLGLLSRDGRPLIVHGWEKLGIWVPEATATKPSKHIVSAKLDSFSPLDVVDYTTWLAGNITGNRTNLPGNCGEIPDWINGASFPKNRNDALPSCISNQTDANTLRINVVNNRGYAQLATVEGARLDVDRSGSWSDSLDGIITKELAQLSRANGPSSFVLAPGASATIALERPLDLVGERPVTIRGNPQGGSAVAQLAWAFLSEVEKVKKKIAVPTKVTNCVVGVVYNSTSSEAGARSSVNGLRSCVEAATGLSGVAKTVLTKIAAAVFVTDVFHKVIDLAGDEAFPPRITFSFKGKPATSRDIRLEHLDVGSITAGQTTVWNITATGGTPPYTFAISTISKNIDRVPDWVELAPDGTLSILPPDGTDENVSFYVFATDATGQQSATGLYEVTFTVEAKSSGSTKPCTDFSRTEQVDIGYHGEAPNEPSEPWYGDVSRDGCRVVFLSGADNLTADAEGPLDGHEDVFMRDLRTRMTTRISAPALGAWSSCAGGVDSPSISGNGRYVAFQTCRDNLIAPTPSGQEYVYIRDTVTGTVEPIYSFPSGPVPDRTYQPYLSETGRYAGFTTPTALTAADTNGKADAYLVDRDTDAVELLSVSPDGSGNPGAEHSLLWGLSADGRFALVGSSADTFDTDSPEPYGEQSYYVRDRQLHITEKVPQPASCDHEVNQMEMSDDGEVILELCEGDGIYLVRRITGTIQLIARYEDPDFALSPTPGHGCTIASAGFTPTTSISPDGRYMLFARMCAPFSGTDVAAMLQRTRVVIHDIATGHEDEIENLENGGCSYGAYSQLLHWGRMASRGASTVLYRGCNGVFAAVRPTSP